MYDLVEMGSISGKGRFEPRVRYHDLLHHLIHPLVNQRQLILLKIYKEIIDMIMKIAYVLLEMWKRILEFYLEVDYLMGSEVDVEEA